jgi:imidazolonepropionase-like amidohydrolase
MSAISNPILTAVHCGQLIDGIANQPISEAVILIKGDRITQVGGKELLQTAAKVIDLSHSFVLPGLIDAHVHPTIGCCNYQLDHLKKSSAAKALEGLKRVQDRLKTGWTTLRVAGSADVGYADLEIRNAINKGLHQGPRIFGAGHYLSTTGGGGDISNYSHEQKLIPDGCIVDGPEEVRKAVRNEIKYGADWIKLLVTGAFMSAGDNPKDVHFAPEELKVAVEEAKRRNVPVMAHAHSTEGIKQSVLAGVRSIEHGTFLDDEAIALMVERGTYLVPTIYLGDYFMNEKPDDEAQAKCNALTKKYRESYMAYYQKAIKAGVKIGLGTDDVGLPPTACAKEFASLMEIGMTAMQAIQAATSVNADLLQNKDIGTIEAGKYADIIAVAKDPLADISELERVQFVMLGGKVIQM